jgi:hypothetical protein
MLNVGELVVGRSVDVVNDEVLYWSFLRGELEPELLL